MEPAAHNALEIGYQFSPSAALAPRKVLTGRLLMRPSTPAMNVLEENP
jgi:hypothetical protein